MSEKSRLEKESLILELCSSQKKIIELKGKAEILEREILEETKRMIKFETELEAILSQKESKKK